MSDARDANVLHLLASYEAALEAARRCLIIARILTKCQRGGTRLPDSMVDAYESTVERAEAQLAELSAQIGEFKTWFRTH